MTKIKIVRWIGGGRLASRIEVKPGELVFIAGNHYAPIGDYGPDEGELARVAEVDLNTMKAYFTVTKFTRLESVVPYVKG